MIFMRPFNLGLIVMQLIRRMLKMKYIRNLYLMCAIAFLQGFVFYGSVSTIYRQHRGLSINSIFILETIFVIIMFALEVPWGYVTDRIGYKFTLEISFLLFFISKIVFYMAYSFTFFLLEAIISSIAISGISGCDTALIYSSINKKESDKAFSYYGASGTCGFLIGSLLSSVIVKYSIDLTAFLTIIPYGLAFIVSMFLKEINDKCEIKEKISLKSSFITISKNKRIFIFIISMALVSESTHAVCVFLNQPIYQRSGIDIKYFGIITAAMQIMCLSSVRSFKLSEKFPMKNIYSVLLMAIISANIMLIFFSEWIIVLIMIAVIEGAFAIFQPLSNTIQNKSINTSDRATLLSTYAMMGDIIASFSNLAIGHASDISLNSALAVCAFLDIVSFALIFIFYRS